MLRVEIVRRLKQQGLLAYLAPVPAGCRDRRAPRTMPKSSSAARRSRKTAPRQRAPAMADMKTVTVIDSHTGGEPTRLVTEGGPERGRGPLAERLDIFRRDFDRVRGQAPNRAAGGLILCSLKRRILATFANRRTRCGACVRSSPES